MYRVALLAAATALAAAPEAWVQEREITGWGGENPFTCVLKQAGFGPAGPEPGADPYCVEFDKRRQNVTQLGVVEFLLDEPARVAAASPKCFYFQSDHWRGSVVQEDEATKTYEWDGHYFFDKARGEGGVWVTNFNVNGRTGDPGALPGVPPEYARHFGPGTGGFRAAGAVEADPRCAERARRDPEAIYAAQAAGPHCRTPVGGVTRSSIGPVRLRTSDAAVRGALGDPLRVHRGFLRYCLTGGSKYLVGLRSDRSGSPGVSSDDPVVMVLTTHRAYRHRGIGRGSSLRALRRALPRARRLMRRGRSGEVWLARPRSAVVLGVRSGRVTFLAVHDSAAIRSRSALGRHLTRSR